MFLGREMTILIVDDMPENIDSLAAILSTEHKIVAATSGEKALEIAMSSSPPDLILLDIIMPETGGYEVCRRLKAHEKTSHIPIIFITALEGVEDEYKGLELGAADYLTKSANPAIVKARVDNQLTLKLHRDHLDSLVEERTKELELTRDATIECMAALAEYRDPETGGHIQRTKFYIKIMAEHLQKQEKFSSYLDDKTIALLCKSTPLHDIGKVGIPDNILLKPGKLTPEEFEIMKQHPVYGRDALRAAERKIGKKLSFLQYASEVAFSHHEKWDGSGYPLGLAGEDIPLVGRLMALADVYDALISKRVYKPPFSHHKAVAIIQEGKGRHFDPLLVDIFMELHEKFREVALQFIDFDEEREMLLKQEE